MNRWLVIAVLLVTSRAAFADPLTVVLRDAGDAPVAIDRLRGQLADLDVELATERGAIEPGLDAQLVSAARLAAAHHARVVVWFVARGGGLAVAIATPADHRLFVREIPPADGSAVAEAAAVAARGAIRAISDGGTIGVEVAPAASVPVIGWELAIGWQVAFDAGADLGAQALAQRTSVTRGDWAASLQFSLGPALRKDGDTAIELARTTATVGVERRFAGFALGATAGAAVYHRSTIATAPDLAATPAVTTLHFVGGPELRWQWRGAGHVGIEAAAGIDFVAGPPEPVVMRGDMQASLGAVRSVQPRLSLKIFMGLP